MLLDPAFNEYINRLYDNRLVAALKEQIALLSGEAASKTYSKRKAIIITTLLAGAVVSFIGSLTFLVGRRFPKEFSEFLGVSIKDSTASEFGSFLGWTNVAIETIFYTWTVCGILPPLQPESKREGALTNDNLRGFRRFYRKLTFYLPSTGEWTLAVASTIPLIFLSLISEEEKDESNVITYGIVSSIALVTLISNKYFLTLTHKQFRNAWDWFRNKNKAEEISPDLLKQVKRAFLETAVRANEKLYHLTKREFESLIKSLKGTSIRTRDVEDQTSDQRWKNLLPIMFRDLSFTPPKVNKKAIFLVPIMAIFAALSWLGLIATVPNGVKEKRSSPLAVQYLLMVIAGIPLIEIGLSAGGSVGLQLSRIGNGLGSLTTNLTSWKIRLLGYIPLGLFGLFSFGTNATLTIQQFESIPAITWMLLPSATLGIDLINIFAGTELWDQASTSASIALSKDKQLFTKYQKFLESLVETIETIPEESLAALLLKVEVTIQDKIKRFIPSMVDTNSDEFIEVISRQLHLRLLEAQREPDAELPPYSIQERERSKNILFNWKNLNHGNSVSLKNEINLTLYLGVKNA